MSSAEKRQNARDSLIEAAEELFTVKSYVSVSTRELAEKAEVNLGAIQYHFGSKAELFVQAVRSMMIRKWQQVLDAMFGGEEPVEKEQAAERLVRFIYAFMEDVCHTEGPDVCRVIYREILSADPENEELTEKLVRTISDEFYAHFDGMLLNLLAKVVPDASKNELCLIAGSIYAASTSLPMDAPFVNHLRGYDPLSEPHFSSVCRHSARFILRGIGLSEQEINRALDLADSFFEDSEE